MKDMAEARAFGSTCDCACPPTCAWFVKKGLMYALTGVAFGNVLIGDGEV